jgi:hypothetical protein
MSFKEKYFKQNYNTSKKINDAKELDIYDVKDYNKFIKHLLFDDKAHYEVKEYIKGLPSDFMTLNAIDLRISKMKFDKYFFSPNFHRIATQRDLDDNEVSLWVLLSNLVTCYKCINFPLVYCTFQQGKNWKAYFERTDHTNILTRISNKSILMQVGLIFYYMYKSRIWCSAPIFDMIDIPKRIL